MISVRRKGRAGCAEMTLECSKIWLKGAFDAINWRFGFGSEDFCVLLQGFIYI